MVDGKQNQKINSNTKCNRMLKHNTITFSLFSSWNRAFFEKLIFAKLVRKIVDIVTDLTVLQIWTLLINGRVRISAFPTQRFSDYTGQRNINPLLRNVCKQNTYFRGNEYC
jgi:hypothetical protein